MQQTLACVLPLRFILLDWPVLYILNLHRQPYLTFNLSAIAYYTAHPNDTIATVNINTYNITEFNFFLVLYGDRFPTETRCL